MHHRLKLSVRVAGHIQVRNTFWFLTQAQAEARQMRVVVACERCFLHDTSNAEAPACAQRQLSRLLQCAWTFLVHYAVSRWR